MALQRMVVRTNQLLLRNVKAAFNAASYSSKSANTEKGGKSKDYIGIDVGSSYIYVSIIDHDTNKPKLIHKIPSTFGIFPLKDPSKVDHNTNKPNIHKHPFGENVDFNPADTVYGCKLLLSRKFSDPLVQEEIEKVTYKIFQGPDGEALIQNSRGRIVTPAFIFSRHLQHARKRADSYLGNFVSRAVITYPAFFSAYQLRQMVKAGLSTGLDLIHTIDETTAAAFAYEMNKKEEGSLFVVIDLGARTFDVSVLQVSAGGRFKFKAPTKSDLFLGGQEFDNALADYLLSESDISDKTKSLVKNEKLRLQKLRGIAESLKVELSYAFGIEFRMAFTEDESSRDTVILTLTRSMFESLVNHLIKKIKNHIQSCLKEADITAVDVDEVLLVGGMSRVPKVRKVVSDIFGKSPSSGLTNPDEAVALGAAAAVQAGHFGKNPWND